MALDTNSIGQRIKRYRTDKSMSQDELGELVFTNRHHIGNIETGNRAPSLELLVSIANALEVSADDLLADNLTHSTSNAGSEIHKLLLDCNPDETKILTRTVEFLKSLLSEFGI